MQGQGTDGASRGDHSTGVLQGDKMTDYIPLHLSAFDRSTNRRKRFKAVLKGLNPKFLEPYQWFDEYHGYGNYIWSPPPAATEAAIDLLNKARHKRPELLHLIVVPRLMTGRWRRALTRTCDTYVQLDWEDAWPLKIQYEPVLCFICMPLNFSSPNLRKRRKLVVKMEDRMSKKGLQHDSNAKMGSFAQISVGSEIIIPPAVKDIVLNASLLEEKSLFGFVNWWMKKV